jgi:D-3-phosphoglycerate dehydrogenase
MAEKLAPSTLEVFGDEVEIRHVDGTDRAALLEAVRDADALLVRSATQVDAEVFAAQTHLAVVGRAGVGLDNVDVPAATAAGVMVVNAPTSNIVSAAEHALALLLATARHIPAADAALRRGEWARSRYSGVEIQGKTVGVIGLGKIGQLFASRISAFDAHVIAYDPYLPQSRAAQLGIELVPLDELLSRADMMTIHLPKTPETQGLIGKEALAKTKPGVIVVNAARGGLVDEEALAEAIRSGHVAGAGVDVYVTEPTTTSPLFELEQVTATPHLGASTAEAQDRAGTDVAHSVLRALHGDFVPDAVNVQGGVVGEEVRPWLGVTQKLGTLLSTLVGQPSNITVQVRGELAAEDVGVLELAALRGIFGEVVDEPVTFVNAPALAAERGVRVEIETASESPNHRSVVTLRAVPDRADEHADRDPVTVSGTLTGADQVEKLVEINGRSFDIRAAGDVVLIEYTDRPGALGQVGTLLGEAGVNIEAAQMSQTRDKVSSVILLRVDQPVPDEVLAPIGQALDARTTRLISLG